MTKINKIVIHGFKSFAKHTEFLFGGDFNCVLGPNGSGKSNVLDALCFVLGKTSSKSLRAEKSANLIYNGGKTKKPGKQGEVSVYFDNESKVFPTPDKTIKITRIIRQNGQSIYKINDKVRTRQQAVDLLSVAKINPDGYNIIMQGDIVRFVEMPTEERRKLIEEISGISVYEEKKRKAMLELDKVGNKLNETEIVLTERSTHLKELKKDRDQALKFKEMNDKIKENRASYLRTQIDKKEKDKKEIQEQLDKANAELEKLQKKITELKQQNEGKKDEIERITKEIEEKGEKDQVNLNREIESFKIELTKKQSRIDVCNNEIDKINNRKKELGNSIKEIDQKIDEINKQKEQIKKDKSEKEKQKYEFSQKIVNFKKKHKLENVGDIEKKIEEIDHKGDELLKEIQTLKEKQHGLIRDKDKISHEINTIDGRIKKMVDIEKEYHDQITDLKNKRQEFKKTTLELNKTLDEDSTISAKLGNTRKKLLEANEELAKLTARNVGIREATYSDIAIKKILGLQKKGVYGTVAELGNVSSKYAVALEIAAGPRLRSIVVEDDRVAAECISFLKEKKLGIATFLPLSKIQGKKEGTAEKYSDARGCHGKALDLVSFDLKFKKIFSYIFGDTLVVDNIDVAR
ncbi:MAG: AAA family ATPase, partial [Candidatus Woesearchaeota archaeon]